jgi:hypothetical protein
MIAATASYGSPRSSAPAAALSRKTIGRKIFGVCVGGYVISDCRMSPPAWVSRTFRGYPADLLDVAIPVHARVGIVDAFAPTSEHGTPPGVMQCELQPLGCRDQPRAARRQQRLSAIFAHPPLQAVCGRCRFKQPRARSFCVVRRSSARPRQAAALSTGRNSDQI